MKYLKLFESFDESEIHEICKQYKIAFYTFNNDGSIDVDKHVDLRSRNLKKIPLKFNKVNGNFYCNNNQLISLEGSPVEVNGNYECWDNKLTNNEIIIRTHNYAKLTLKTFKGAPKIIRGNFDCEWNKINSFEYFPIHVGGIFNCSNNPIWEVWKLFGDITKIELLNDFDIFRDEYTNNPSIVMDRLNDFLLTIDKDPVNIVHQYKNI